MTEMIKGFAFILLMFFFCEGITLSAAEKIASEAKLRASETGGMVREEIVRQDARVEFSVKPVYIREILEGEVAEINLKITDSTTGSPITTLRPFVWIDLIKEMGERNRAVLSCKDKIGLYMQGSISFRPDLDLNSYFILSMNNDPTISVIDPIVGVRGITQLYTMIHLKQPGEDWVLSRDEKNLFVTMPKAGQVAVVETESFKVVKNIDAGAHPVRILLQPDRKYLWVGNDSSEQGRSGVTVIDAEQLNRVAFIPTGAGSHQIAFSEDSLFAFVTNQKEGTLSIIDVQRLSKVKEIRVGDHPSAVAYSRLAQAVYVANGGDGSIVVLDGKRHEVIARIETKPGLKALRFEPGGRWGFAVNSKEDKVYIIDASINRIVYAVEVGRGPDQIAFTKTYAYIRSKGAPEFALIQLSSLGKEGSVPLLKIPGGQRPPAESRFESVAEAIIPAPEEGHALIVNPADGMIYYYMEGMMASMGSFRSVGGHVPRAVRVVDRSLRETEQGVYSARIRVPSAGTYQVAFLLDSPRIIHCFEFSASDNPVLSKGEGRLFIEFLTDERRVKAGESFRLRLRLIDSSKSEPIQDVQDLTVLATLGSGLWFDRYRVRSIGNGIYEVDFVVPRPGALYLNFTAPSLKVGLKEFPSLALEVIR